MTDGKTGADDAGLELEYSLDAPTERVWRAISIAEFRKAWLPDGALADPEATAVTPGEALSFRMRDGEPPFRESTVTFQIAPDGRGGTRLRIVHAPDRSPARAANGNDPVAMLAA